MLRLSSLKLVLITPCIIPLTHFEPKEVGENVNKDVCKYVIEDASENVNDNVSKDFEEEVSEDVNEYVNNDDNEVVNNDISEEVLVVRKSPHTKKQRRCLKKKSHCLI